MRIKAVPVREKIVNQGGFIPAIWHNFLDSIVIRLNSGATGTFTTADAKTVTVVDGIITEIT